jgi:RNA ligase
VTGRPSCELGCDGLRLKVEEDEYKRIHEPISRVTPLAIWEAMAAGNDIVTSA